MSNDEVVQLYRCIFRFALDTLGGDANYVECKKFIYPILNEEHDQDEHEFNFVKDELKRRLQSLPSKRDRDASHIRRILRKKHGIEDLRIELRRLNRDQLLNLIGLHDTD